MIHGLHNIKNKKQKAKPRHLRRTTTPDTETKEEFFCLICVMRTLCNITHILILLQGVL